jgi:hypothetical protein
MNKTTVLHFGISGDWITETARQMFYQDGKSYSEVEKLLLDCLESDDLSIEKRKKMAQDIIIGKSRLTGNTSDGTYKFTDDNSENIIFEFIDSLNNRLAKATKDLNTLEEEYDTLARKYYDCDEESEDSEETNDEPSISPLISGYLKANKYDNNYGWLSPSGEFTSADFGYHLDCADSIIKDYGWTDEYNEWMRNNISVHNNGFAGDFLVYSKGWVLIDNPSQGLGIPTFDESRNLTDKQREFLFKYYEERDECELANKYWEV